MGSFFRRATFLWFPTQTFHVFLPRVVARNFFTGASSSLTRIAYPVRYVRLAKTVFRLPANCYATVKVVSFTAFRGGFREKYYSHELCLLCQNFAHLSIFIFVGEKAHTPSRRISTNHASGTLIDSSLTKTKLLCK